ncbi:mucin-5AC isoform X1 [Drosophila gunungcola]|uniref:mucin-5AC isoform X1 n=1 Tax=Drosophila gunungcola TaxID=103775 RepID=UPI0022E1BC0B|nr:mucin-5AC isoform X1 [Drosophila gunungcola]XP_052837769.1 mucin-5AC isoform X1 [Drosophila gunungcola]XP_052837770.1 mucin-5AC isoform X1 [Drosophila gunungcola]XP_052837771.1 mucin-5AC isoform X1 [Drosophila gunungcola]XP_052837772.1 mucin-5AC isoform X1 [Drosophila gunungcola]XP_052837773.1 mucin-5AC isoform X1 [Drosophila gunungcola]XP_052837774.1 mucin-5AC isoform X1 [Drosophila gunungcola]
MLHNNRDNEELKTSTTTTTTTIEGNGTEPTNRTHFATSSAAASAAETSAGEEEINATAEGQLPPTTTAAAYRTELGETADALAASNAATAAESPAFDVQMRTQQRQKIKIYHDAKQTAVWRTDSLASNPSSTMCPDFAKSGAGEGTPPMGLPPRGIILSTAPSLLQRKSSDSSLSSSVARRVSFPDNELVTGYLEPANPWKQVCLVSSISEIVEQYEQSCQKHHTKPKESVTDHLKSIDLSQARQPLLPLKANQLSANDCEALEEIFKRIQYKCIDLSDCTLDESCLMALFQMIEYYEACYELDISYNKEQMTKRCWELCAYMVERSQKLKLLNAESNQITKLGADSLGRALGSSNLHTLKLEHCGLRGQPLVHLLSFAGRGLYQNKMLKELWVGYNDLDCVDAQHIADMLRYNHSLELIDISNNNIRNEGVMHLVQALILQSTELERRMGALKRTRAIEVDECVSPVETEPPAALPQSASSATSVDSELSSHVTSIPETPGEEAVSTDPAVGILVDVDNDNDDENTEDTVRTVRNCSQIGGQSMLDKLLSMNSDSSSEEAPSNISTDTLAAVCSEDISEISNDIFEASTAKQPPAGDEVDPAVISSSPTESESVVPVSAPEERLSPAQQQQSSQNERNLCDITPSTEAKPIEPNESCVQNNIINNNNNNNANNSQNNTNNNNTIQMPAGAGATATLAVEPPLEVETSPSGSAPAAIFEVTPEESDCINGSGAGAGGSRPLDVNKNAKVGDDFEDTHSTDSAFESASEGDISRHLPEEFSRLSVSLESTRLDDMAKEMCGIETATIATESTECLLAAQEAATPTPAPAAGALDKLEDPFPPPKVTIAEECLQSNRELSQDPFQCPSPAPTPPPPSTSPGGASIGLRRTESSCAYLNQSTRNRSQSSDSLCSETSLDGMSSGASNNSVSSTATADPKFAEKLTKNDTLSRRQLAEATLEANRSPSGLKALTLWNNNLTKDCAPAVAELLQKTISLELLNIGKNCLSNEFVSTIKDSLTKNTTLTTLGLQSAHLSAKGFETLASILTFGGNSKLQRIDIRDNKLEVESLNIIAEVLKSNKTLTQIDINDEPKRLTLPIVPIVNVIPPSPLPQESIGSDAHLDYTRVLGTVRSLCSRNEKRQAQELAEKAANVVGGNSSLGGSLPGLRCRGGYYLGSRKISLTCHSRPFVDAATGTVTGTTTATAAATAMPTPAALLEVKRKSGPRLRSPGPSPPTISPSSSPNRSRFQVSRVAEVASPLISPLAQHPPPHTPRSASSCMSIPTIGSPSGSQSSLNAVGALPTSSSLPAMASVTSSTQTVKRLSVSPRSRFQVSRIYEDPQVPMANRQLPPITPHTPPIDLPPTPMLKSARKAVKLSQAVEAAAAAVPVSSVVIVEACDDSDAHNSTKVEEAAVQKLTPHLTISPTSSHSSSTSPGCSSSSSSSGSSSNSNGSTSTDVTDSVASGPETAPKTCPLAVFGDNDITLTKESAGVVALSAAAAASHMNPVLETESEPLPLAEPVSNAPQTRARKTSWIANPSAVDKLLTLFNSGTIFQRSSSPEPKASHLSTVPAANQITNSTQNAIAASVGGASGGDCSTTPYNPILSVARKTSPASWTSLTGSNISNSSQNTSSHTDTGSSSFLDTASRQLRDFSKQVFRQNISFNNSGEQAASVAAAQHELSAGTSASSSTESPSPPECNAAHMPLSLKRQLKENISPEHTINEETLHTLQKLSRAEDVALKAEAATELGDIEIVMHSEVADCHLAENTQPEQEESCSSVV